MPFRAGSISVRRFQVLGDLPEDFEAMGTNAMRRYAFRPINDEKGERESVGWVNPRRVLDQKWTWDHVSRSNLVFLALRRDRKTFSKVLFRARLEELIEKTMKERKIQKLTRQNRIALEEQLSIEMLKETSPTSAFYEMIWDTARGELFSAATSNAAAQPLIDMFEATFDLHLRARFPAIIGADFIAAQGLEDEFRAVEAAVPAAIHHTADDSPED